MLCFKGIELDIPSKFVWLPTNLNPVQVTGCGQKKMESAGEILNMISGWRRYVKSLQKSHAPIPLNEGWVSTEQTCRVNASHARHMAHQLLPEAH